MKIAIMQPYFMPYIGYFQLINAVDRFVIYDDIQYTKKGWINRNRILQNNDFSYITLPLKKGSDFLDIKERYLTETWGKDRKKLLNKIYSSYQKSPYFKQIFPLIEEIIIFKGTNLFEILHNSIVSVLKILDIKTPLIISSSLSIDKNQKAENKVIEICKALDAQTYINPIGGMTLYNSKHFKQNNLELKYLKSSEIRYSQFKTPFVPWLSIIDVLMFNGLSEVKRIINFDYDFI